jgi:hypothetical protein
MRDVDGLVAFASEDNWRKVGGVSLYEQMLDGKVAGDLAQFIGSSEGQDAGEADIAAHGDRRFRQGAGRAEAVQQEGEIAAGVAFLLQDQGDVGVAGVDAGGRGVSLWRPVVRCHILSQICAVGRTRTPICCLTF